MIDGADAEPGTPETTEAAGRARAARRGARAAGTRAPPTKKVSAGTSGRISSVLWINTGCPARNKAARRATRRVVPTPRDEEDQDHGKRCQRQRHETPEDQEMSGGVEGPIDREPAEERREREVVPGRVVFEEVLVREQPSEHAPGRVSVLEFVVVEGADEDDRNAGHQKSDGRRQ